MSRALAIETSGRTGSIALVEDAEVLDEQQFAYGLKNAAGLIPLIDQAIRRRNWQPRDLHELYVSSGPGSFTGLRIGITLAKAFALATGAKLVAVPTLDVLAHNAPDDALDLIVLLDAKRGQIFTARYSRKEPAAPWIAVEPAHLDRLFDMLARAPRPVHLLGEGIPIHRASVPPDPQVTLSPPDTWRARASLVARLGIQLAAAGHFADLDRLTPLYIRRPEAEEKLLGQQPQPI